MKRLWLLLVICCTPTLAAEITLVIPKLSNGQVASAEGDRLHARYDAAWAKYEQAIAKVVADVTQALDDEFNKAADAGSLDSADMWDKKKKAFLESNAVTIEIPDKPKAPARKKPTPDAPKTFPEILQAAQQETDNAVSALKSDYETLIREYTKARNLERAKQLKEEVAGFATASAERPKMVEEHVGDLGGLESLQGIWAATQVDRHGTPMTPQELREQARRLTIEGTKLTFEETHGGKVTTYSGNITVDLKSGFMDWDGTGPGGHPLKLVGIYQLKGGVLRWSYRANLDGNARRPNDYRAFVEKPNFSMVYTLRKVKK